MTFASSKDESLHSGQGGSSSRRLRIALLLPLSFEAPLVGEGIWRVIKELLVAHARQRDRYGIELIPVGAEWVREEYERELRNALGEGYVIPEGYFPPVRLLIVKALWGLYKDQLRKRARRQQRRWVSAIRRNTVRSALARVHRRNVTALMAGMIIPVVGAYYALKFWLADRERKPTKLVRWLLSRANAALVESEICSVIYEAQRKHRPDLWWVPYPSAMGLVAVPGKPVMHVYDLVYADYPKDQALWLIAQTRLDFKLSLQRAAHVVTHSRHVSNNVAVPLLEVPPEKISVIPHASPNLRPHVTDKTTGKLLGRHALALIIRHYIEQKSTNWPVVDEFSEEIILPRLRAFPFETAQYVLMSTQNRSYKNTIIVLKALRVLNQHRSRKVFLALTGQVRMADKSDPLARYAIAHNLVQYLLPLPRVPDSVLAALYAGAAMAIHPSFYEGGVGAFPFYEGMSVDCPVLVSDNASMREALETEPGYSDFLFNPHNTGQLIRMMESVLDKRDAWVDKARPVYQRVSQRSWNDLLDEYVRLFESVFESDRGRS